MLWARRLDVLGNMSNEVYLPRVFCSPILLLNTLFKAAYEEVSSILVSSVSFYLVESVKHALMEKINQRVLPQPRR